MRMTSFIAKRLALGAALASSVAVFAPAACVYPDYVFTEPEIAGGGGSPQGSDAASSSASSSTGVDTHGEDCANGVDDNGDGAIDCADPGCGPVYACVSDVPAGWLGHVSLFEGDSGADPGCPAGTFPKVEYSGNAGLNAPPTCEACACSAPPSQSCTLGNTPFVYTTTCEDLGGSFCAAKLMNVPTDGGCYQPDGVPGGQNMCGTTICTGNGPCNVAIEVPAATVASSGTCVPLKPKPSPAQPSWATVGLACSPAAKGGGCNVGQACLPRTAAPYNDGLCIYKEGINVCPAVFPKQHIYYKNLVDERSCAACQCGKPGGGACSATVSFYKDSGCNTLVATVGTGTCQNITGNPNLLGRKVSDLKITTQASCPPSGGEGSGAATPTEPTTFCCK